MDCPIEPQLKVVCLNTAESSPGKSTDPKDGSNKNLRPIKKQQIVTGGDYTLTPLKLQKEKNGGDSNQLSSQAKM